MAEQVKDKTASGLEGAGAGYNGHSAPSAAELKAPVKIYPGASKLPTTPGKGLIEGPCSEVKGGYHRPG